MSYVVEDNKCLTPVEDVLTAEWIDLPLASGVASIAASGARPQYRKIGDRVEIRGTVALDYSSAGDITTVFAALPEGYRPPTQLYKSIPLVGARVGRLHITAAGNMNVNYIYNYSSGSMDTGTSFTWAQIDIEYSV